MQIKKHFLILFSSCLPGNTSKNIRQSNDPNQSRTQTEKASCNSGRENGSGMQVKKKREKAACLKQKKNKL